LRQPRDRAALLKTFFAFREGDTDKILGSLSTSTTPVAYPAPFLLQPFLSRKKTAQKTPRPHANN